MTSRDTRAVPSLSLFLAVFVLIEWLLLRLGTRTLIHIPGLGRLESMVAVLAETGRFAYYASVVLLIALLCVMGARGFSDGRAARIASVAVTGFVGAALIGRLGWISAGVVGWAGVVALITVAAVSWRGRETVPVAFFAASTLAATISQLGQGSGGGLSVSQVDGLVITAEMLLILAGLTSPLLLSQLPSPRSLLIGVGSAIVISMALGAASSTVTILLLWSLGVPGWLPGITYALAFGVLVTTVASGIATRDFAVAVGLVLLMAGGVGAISTYQTGLALAGLLLIGFASPTQPVADNISIAGRHRREMLLSRS